jgi:prevent-host-death family protein
MKAMVMEETVSAADVNRRFLRLLRWVRKGRTCAVTVHGKPAAKIVPIENADNVMTAARAVLFAWLSDQPVLDAGRWTRDEL